MNRAQGFDMRSTVMELWLDHRVCPLGGMPRCSDAHISSLKRGGNMTPQGDVVRAI